jgi:hypothetical protein
MPIALGGKNTALWVLSWVKRSNEVPTGLRHGHGAFGPRIRSR